MAKVLTINGSSFEFPQNNEDPNWAQDVTAWAEAVSSSIEDLLAASDLIVGSEVIGNNVTSETPLSDLVFSPDTIRAAHISYVVYRTSDSWTTDVYETGVLYLVYDTNASASYKWILGLNTIGDAGITFSVTDFGQVEYTTTDIDDTGYTGKITYSVKLFAQ